MAARTLLQREPLLIVLAASAGAVDAISFLTFDVFTANMTGNVVLLGLALSAWAGAEAVRAAVALAGFAVGVVVAARTIGPPARPAGEVAATQASYPPAHPAGWRPRVTAVIAATLVLQLAFAAGWLVADGSPTGAGRDVLVAISALAMGAQSAAVASLGLPNLATTYVTGTLTGLLGSLATGTRAGVDALRASVIAGLALGATAGALLVSHARDVAPLLPAALTAVVIAAAITRRHVK